MLKLKLKFNSGTVIFNLVARLKKILLELILKLWKISWCFCPVKNGNLVWVVWFLLPISVMSPQTWKRWNSKKPLKENKTYPWLHYAQCLELSLCLHSLSLLFSPILPCTSKVFSWYCKLTSWYFGFHSCTSRIEALLDLLPKLRCFTSWFQLMLASFSRQFSILQG